MASPRHDEMSGAVGASHHGNCREGRCFVQEDMVEREEDLLGVEPELFGDDFNRVDRRSIDVCLASLSKPAVARANVKAVKECLERRWTAVDRRRLDDFSNEESSAVQKHAVLPQIWRRSADAQLSTD